LVNELQAVKALRQGLGYPRMAREKLIPVWLAPGFERDSIFLQGADDKGILQPSRRLFVVHRFFGAESERVNAVTADRPVITFLHEEPPSERRKRARARAQRFFTLLTVRPMRLATSGKLSPSR